MLTFVQLYGNIFSYQLLIKLLNICSFSVVLTAELHVTFLVICERIYTEAEV